MRNTKQTNALKVNYIIKRLSKVRELLDETTFDDMIKLEIVAELDKAANKADSINNAK